MKYNDSLLQEMLEHGIVINSFFLNKNNIDDMINDETCCLHLSYEFKMVHLRMVLELRKFTSLKVTKCLYCIKVYISTYLYLGT